MTPLDVHHQDNDRQEALRNWINKALDGFISFSKSSVNSTASAIVFGRCSVRGENAAEIPEDRLASKETLSPLKKLRIAGRPQILDKSSCERPWQTQLANVKTSLFSPQDDKHRGRQISNTKFDLKQASEKRKRQIQYSKEVQVSRKGISLDTDSIYRVVVKSFCKLIDCERCSLFWMDHTNNELYFKPLGEDAPTGVIRFSASVGIAGWVATNKMIINVPDAYQNEMFNKDVDRRTNFKTRTILCAPILVDGTLRAVVQMLNKFKDVTCTPELRSPQRKGFIKSRKYISFSVQDEALLQQCCEEVARAVKRNNFLVRFDDSPKTMSNSNYIQEENDAVCNDSFVDHRFAIKGSAGRRRSVGSLMMFVNKLSQQSYLPYADAPIDEMFDIISQSEAIKVSRKGIIGRRRSEGS
mmetsp:Transcript_5790/g.8527  ORF Transcript_5790/g.8527 Transcript_5790/m.8527 type:complete len:413 (-) Transcript_5790:941-2179(-)|eukprot:CAMPEP_0172421054 /NCGR_PEP_ID=MMETSP1064-20121228/7340_1 /TAXON_ID=202472 /ORGANISM="Aulacoseira subarctica , Strain CCAP 1002/5" /LENGTH=412 /DNA_ID=CAMNT_0013161267 /DNA_START=100 /DNA_END=1338 /DNA_ORIENTATION=+